MLLNYKEQINAHKIKMKKIVVLIFFLILSNISFAQLKEGFDPEEVKDLIAICNSYTFLDLYGTDTLIIPNGYRKVYTSDAFVLDNMFQVYEYDNRGVINFRGTTTKTSSWLENLYSAMIPGEGTIKVDYKNYPYKFADDTSAAVHSGYALATILLSSELIRQINLLNSKNIYDILITGHSQGGALAHLVRAYLGNLPDSVISSKNVFKTYTFANPMCGNKAFATEYETRYSDTNMSYTIINTADLIPKLPTHFQENSKFFGYIRFKYWVYGLDKIDPKNMLNFIIKLFEPVLQVYIKHSNKLIKTLVSASSYISIDMPPYVNDIDYTHVGNIRTLEPFPVPDTPVDITNMTEEEIASLDHDQDGNYYYHKESFYQHKPYNYYVEILREYFSKDYRNLELLYLHESSEANKPDEKE